jgi:DNA-binding TFAR19-related protein (PDSD5 family)
MRVDNLDNYFNAYSEDPINKEVLDRLERVEKAYNSLSEKVKGYLKQLHQQGMITVPMEVLE